MYITLSQASEKYNISRGKLQVLCRSDKIPGAYKSGGIWLIPDDVSSASVNSETSLTVEQLCEILSISEATAANWLRLGKIHAGEDGKFANDYVRSLRKQIKQADNPTLKRRRNKKSLTESKLYDGYISNSHNYKVIESFVQHIALASVKIQIPSVLAAFAVEMYTQAKELTKSDRSSPDPYILKKYDEVFDVLIDDLLKSATVKIPESAAKNKKVPLPFPEEVNSHVKQIKYVAGEDTLGFIYSSLRCLGTRKISGSYFTPAAVVDKLVADMCNVISLSDKTVCDPCCGTGIFMIKLALDGVPLENLYGCDLDVISIKLARINMFFMWLKENSHGNSEALELAEKKDLLGFLSSHFTVEDSLLSSHACKYDVIIGNPPWGADLPKEYLESLIPFLDTAKSGSDFSSDLFLEKAMNALPSGGLLAFVLPESILSVGSHRDIRRIMVQKAVFKFVHYLGDAFSGVQCPSVILGLEKKHLLGDEAGTNTAGCRVFHNTSYIIGNERSMTCDSFSFNVNDREYSCIEVIESVNPMRYLRGNSKFGLGIVTGDNRKFVTSVKALGCEPILRGRNVFRYSLADSGEYISFRPEKFQQVAPEEIYRAKEKLVYRFICRVPVFALDRNQTLSLNSCNVLIPQIPELDIKYVLAVLNSSVAAFYLGKKYNSVKLLRSHIESLPIPWVSAENQKPIIDLVEEIMASDGSDKLDLYRELDGIIGELYGLDEGQMAMVEGYAVAGNMFITGG